MFVEFEIDVRLWRIKNLLSIPKGLEEARKKLRQKDRMRVSV